MLSNYILQGRSNGESHVCLNVAHELLRGMERTLEINMKVVGLSL